MNEEQIRNKIKCDFKDAVKQSIKLKNAILKYDNKQVLQYLNNKLLKQPEWQKISYLIIGIVKDIQLLKCQVCGKPLKYSSIIHKSKYCNIQCKLKSQSYLQQLHNHKITQQTLKKRKETCLKKYGVQNVSQSQQIKDKKCQTQMKNFGVAYSFQSKQLLEKSKKTCLEKYGVQHNSQIQKIKQIKRNKLLKWNYNEMFRFSKYVIPLFSYDDYLNNKDRIWKCQKCGNQFIQNKIYNTGHINESGYNCCPRCLNCYPFLFGQSRKQNEVYQFIKTIYDGQIIQHDRKLIAPKQLDIVIPQLKLAIQFNGNYWHSSNVKIDDFYHKDKTLLAQKIGYRLIHIFQFQWTKKQQIIKQKLKSIILKNQKAIYARKCQIKQISSKEKNQFLNKFHLQGEDRSSIKLGLFYQNQLDAVMTFNKSRYNKNFEFELNRYATSKRVIGGAGKLLKYFQRIYHPKSLITYADRRYSQGNMYFKLGFQLDHFSEPNFIWCSQNQNILINRFKLLADRIKKTFPQYTGQNIDEFMSQKGFNKLYDCGNYVFVKRY